MKIRKGIPSCQLSVQNSDSEVCHHRKTSSLFFSPHRAKQKHHTLVSNFIYPITIAHVYTIIIYFSPWFPRGCLGCWVPGHLVCPGPATSWGADGIGLLCGKHGGGGALCCWPAAPSSRQASVYTQSGHGRGESTASHFLLFLVFFPGGRKVFRSRSKTQSSL